MLYHLAPVREHREKEVSVQLLQAPRDGGEFDVVVVGAGLAGSVAALRARELGCRALLIDRGNEPAEAGNTRFSGGTMHIAERHPVETPADELAQRASDLTDGLARPELLDALAANAARAVGWIGKQGIEFEPPERAEQDRLVFAPARSFQHLRLWRDAGPHRALERLHARFTAAGGELRGATTALELVVDPDTGGVAGLLVRDAGGIARFRARTVVLADGGFQANRAMVQQHIGRFADRILLRGAASGKGDAIRMAEPLRAQLVNMPFFYGHLLHRDALTDDALWPMPMLDPLLAHGLLVDAAGGRLLDESRGGIAAANVIARLDDPLGTWIVADARAFDEVDRAADPLGRRPTVRDLEQRGGAVTTASSVAELAARIQIDPARLKETVRTYNHAVAEGASARLAPPRVRVTRALEPPFRAVPVVPGITFTMGGLQIDAHARVLDVDNRPIPGLLAAGGSAGGVQGGPRGGYVGGLSPALVFGLLAAETAGATVGSEPAKEAA
jgi:fumarate reductase flavoprotein subunit